MKRRPLFDFLDFRLRLCGVLVPVITLRGYFVTSLTSTWSWVCPFSNFFPPLALSVVTIVSLDSINCHLSLSILIANLFTPSAINFLGSWTILSDHESTVSCHAPIGARNAPGSNPLPQPILVPPYPIFP